MYVTDILSWELFLQDIRQINAINDIMWKKFPDIAKKGDKLVQIVKDCGFDSPEKQINIFDYFIEFFNLQQNMSVKTLA